MSLSMGMFFNLQHTHPGVDKSSQVPGEQVHSAMGSGVERGGDLKHGPLACYSDQYEHIIDPPASK